MSTSLKDVEDWSMVEVGMREDSIDAPANAAKFGNWTFLKRDEITLLLAVYWKWALPFVNLAASFTNAAFKWFGHGALYECSFSPINNQIWLLTFIPLQSLLFWHFINMRAYHLDWYKPSCPYAKLLHCYASFRLDDICCRDTMAKRTSIRTLVFLLNMYNAADWI